MSFWDEVQLDMRIQAERRRAKQARKIAHAFLLSAWTTPPAPTGARETAAKWATQALLNIPEEPEK